jgi:hypothetical protein
VNDLDPVQLARVVLRAREPVLECVCARHN